MSRNKLLIQTKLIIFKNNNKIKIETLLKKQLLLIKNLKILILKFFSKFISFIF